MFSYYSVIYTLVKKERYVNQRPKDGKRICNVEIMWIVNGGGTKKVRTGNLQSQLNFFVSHPFPLGYVLQLTCVRTYSSFLSHIHVTL